MSGPQLTRHLSESILTNQSEYYHGHYVLQCLLSYRGYKKNQFPCQYPGTCTGKQSVFGRPADLERHYKNVHSDSKDTFFCNFTKCPRSQDPFGRKDHYRDHLRDFHKEDIGCAKGEKSFRDKQDKREWHRAQKAWLAERVISSKHWRCARCLFKNYVAQAGWDCLSCKIPCEEARIRARQRLGSDRQTPEDPTEVTMTNGYAPPVPYGSCGTCNGGWVETFGAYVACQLCVPAARAGTPGFQSYDSSGYNPEEYDPARASGY